MDLKSSGKSSGKSSELKSWIAEKGTRRGKPMAWVQNSLGAKRLQPQLFLAKIMTNQNIAGETSMTPTVQQILKNASLLSPIDRAELIEQLFLSFDRSEEQSVDAAWRQEIEDRLDAYDAGQIEASPAEDVLARISQR